mgnify:CR=1 FL=1
MSNAEMLSAIFKNEEILINKINKLIIFKLII